jgi:predicted RNA-binding Zn-ribbon protein involved in translation (DUF1610 family)
MVCKNYTKKICARTCDQDWVRCSLCRDYLDLPIDEFEMNGYTLEHASIDCDWAVEREDTEMVICPKCFKEKILPLKKPKKRKKNMNFQVICLNCGKKIPFYFEIDQIRDKWLEHSDNFTCSYCESEKTKVIEI